MLTSCLCFGFFFLILCSGYRKHHSVGRSQEIHVLAHYMYDHKHKNVGDAVASGVLQRIRLLYYGCLKEHWFLSWPSHHVSQPSVPQGARG